jgi:hypothetical protein
MRYKYFFNKNEGQRGAIATLLTFLILVVVLLIATGLSLIFVGETKESRLVGYSGPAFYAGDSGAEYALFQIVKKSVNVNPGSYYTLNLSYIPASAKVTWNAGSSNSFINSVGSYSGTLREVKITW